MLGWLASGMVVVGALDLLDSYMIRNLRKWRYFLGDCMTISLGWDLKIPWCGWGQRMTPSQLSLFTPLWLVGE